MKHLFWTIPFLASCGPTRFEEIPTRGTFRSVRRCSFDQSLRQSQHRRVPSIGQFRRADRLARAPRSSRTNLLLRILGLPKSIPTLAPRRGKIRHRIDRRLSKIGTRRNVPPLRRRPSGTAGVFRLHLASSVELWRLERGGLPFSSNHPDRSNRLRLRSLRGRERRAGPRRPRSTEQKIPPTPVDEVYSGQENPRTNSSP